MRVERASALAGLLLIIACGESDGENGGTGGTTVEPGPTCTEFCARAVGECEAFLTTEASCRVICQEDDVDPAYALLEVCGAAVESVFQCATALETCDELYAWRDQLPPDDYPCRERVLTVDAVCPFED